LPLPLLLLSPPPPPPAFVDPFVGWLLHCCLPSVFTIACHHAAVNALVAGLFCRQLLSTATTAATAATAAAAAAPGLPPPPPPPPRSNSPSYIDEERGSSSTAYQLQHHVKTFTVPDNLDLFNLSKVFEVCDAGQGNLAISKLLA
jgi:hypothetical protein